MYAWWRYGSGVEKTTFFIFCRFEFNRIAMPAGHEKMWKTFNTKVVCLFTDCYKLPEPLQIRARDAIEKNLDVLKVKIRDCTTSVKQVKENVSHNAEIKAVDVQQDEEPTQIPADVLKSPSDTGKTPHRHDRQTRRNSLIPKGRKTPQIEKSPNPVQAAKSPNPTAVSALGWISHQGTPSSSRPRRSTPKKLPDDFVSGVKRKVSRSSIVLDDAVRSSKKKKGLEGVRGDAESLSGDAVQPQTPTGTDVAVKVEPEVMAEAIQESPSPRKSRRSERKKTAGEKAVECEASRKSESVKEAESGEAQPVVREVSDEAQKILTDIEDDNLQHVQSDVENDVSDDEGLLESSLQGSEVQESKDDDEFTFVVTENPPDDLNSDEPVDKQPDLLQMKFCIPPNPNSTMQARAEQDKDERAKANEADRDAEQDEEPLDEPEKTATKSGGKKKSAQRSPIKQKRTPLINNYQCPRCPRYFEYDYLLTAHIAQHISGPCTIRCDICQKDFKSRSGYITHMRMHSGIDLCKCPQCDYVSGSASQVRAHLRQKHERNATYLCDVCGQGFVTSDRMKRHREALHNRPKEDDYIRCDLCPFKTANRYGLKSHVRNKHSNDPASFVCTICGTVLKSKQSLLDHQKRHYSQKNFQCSLCSFLGICEKDVKNHIRRMHLDTVYKCDVCGKVFKQSGHLARHAVIHTGVQDYECKKCSYKCNVKGNLTKHMAQVHKTMIRIRNVIEKVDNVEDSSDAELSYIVPKQEEDEKIAVEEAITAAETLSSTVTETPIFEVPIEVNSGQVEYQQVMYMQTAPDEVLDGQVVYTVAPDESVYS